MRFSASRCATRLCGYATIRLFDPDYDVGAVQPKGPRHRQQWFASGECQRLVLEALRDALEPLSARA